MMRLVASCVWVSAVTAAATYVSGSLQLDRTEAAKPANGVESFEHKKTQPINVPMIAHGTVEGYVIARFVYLADAHDLGKLSVPPDVFIADEAFRTLYSSTLDFRHLEKYDLPALTRSLVEKVNRRLGGEIIKDILVDEFAYVPQRAISR